MLMHTDSNAGFAIEPLERLFFRLAVELGAGERSFVHFAYPSLRNGFPSTLPPDTSVIEFNVRTASDEDVNRLLSFVKTHRIDFVLLFDQQPVNPLFRMLRSSGVSLIMSYWGAEISSRNSFLKLLAKRAQFFFSPSKIDGLIFESQAMADLARHGRGVPESLIDVVPLGIDVNRFQPGTTTYVHDALGIARERRVIVYAGHMEPRKGVRYLIEAAIELLETRRRNDFSLLIFGNRQGDEDVFSAIHKGRSGAEHIIFGGYRSDLHLCFPSCFAGVIPSSGWDSFPRTSLEFAAAGLPLIVTRLGGLPETIVDGLTGLLCEPANSQQLADTIEALLDNPELAASLGNAGRLRCEAHFTIDSQYHRLLSVVRNRLAVL